MISDYYFRILHKANQQLADQWNHLVNLRSENEPIDNTKLQQMEMAYFHSLQIVLDAVENAINSNNRISTIEYENKPSI